MNRFNGTWEGDLVTGDSVQINGTVSGDVIVKSTGDVDVKGVVDGVVSVQSGGVADISGVVGGYDLAEGGNLTIAVGAIVNGRVLDEFGAWVPIPRQIEHERRSMRFSFDHTGGVRPV